MCDGYVLIDDSYVDYPPPTDTTLAAFGEQVILLLLSAVTRIAQDFS